MPRVVIPKAGSSKVTVKDRTVQLTNLDKPFWPELGITKGDLIQYYADVAPVLLPHIRDRAMVMKRYPHGAAWRVLLHEAAPSPRPRLDSDLPRSSTSPGNVIDFPVIDDLPSLLWVINLGCIDLNQWYATLRRRRSAGLPALRSRSGRRRGVGAGAARAAASSDDALESLEMPPLVKTTRLDRASTSTCRSCAGPMQKDVWTFAKALAVELASRHPKLMTAEYKVANRPQGRVLVDYNQNAWGRTLASVYSVRPRPRAGVSTPVTWKEIDRGVRDRGLPARQRPRAHRRRSATCGSRCCGRRGGWICGRYLGGSGRSGGVSAIAPHRVNPVTVSEQNADRQRIEDLADEHPRRGPATSPVG